MILDYNSIHEINVVAASDFRNYLDYYSVALQRNERRWEVLTA